MKRVEMPDLDQSSFLGFVKAMRRRSAGYSLRFSGGIDSTEFVELLNLFDYSLDCYFRKGSRILHLLQ